MGSTVYDTFNISQMASPRWLASKIWLDSVPEPEQDQVLQDLCLAYPSWFFETLIEVEGQRARLERYQIKYLLDQSTRCHMVATRQGGKSFAVSSKKFIKALQTPDYKCDIVSVNLTEATDKIRYIRNFYETLPRKWRPVLGKDNYLSIQFRRGNGASTITSKAASTGVRGGRKDMVFDEAHHIDKLEEHYKAGLPATMRSQGTSPSQVDLLSTPNGQVGLFHDIAVNKNNKYKGWSRHQFLWFDCSHFITDYKAARKAWVGEFEEQIGPQGAHMRELVDRFGSDRLLEMVEDLAWEDFLQEFCCVFLDEATAFYPWDLIRRCHGDWVPSDLNIRDEDKPKKWLEPWTERPANNVAEVYMGVDFAKNKAGGDQSSIQIVERAHNGGLLHRFGELHDEPQYRENFDAILARVSDLIGRFRPAKVRVDATGMGIPLTAELTNRHGHLIEGVTFGNANKAEMAQLVKSLMERDMLMLPVDRERDMEGQRHNKRLNNQIHAIQRTFLPSGAMHYEGKPHDDAFWALALACKGSGKSPLRVWSPGR